MPLIYSNFSGCKLFLSSSRVKILKIQLVKSDNFWFSSMLLLFKLDNFVGFFKD